MKKLHCYTLFFALFFLASCTSVEKNKKPIPKEKELVSLPFTYLQLEDMESFSKGSTNWKLASSVYADRTKEKHIDYIEGKGILVNVPNATDKDNLFTKLEHGDIEVEFDVLMPKGSNSGVYFQGRYEVQLLDSWGKADVGSGDIGGVYQRWDASKEEGEKGFEGSKPLVNASKSPGLWQHFKIVFIAPKFDATGKKISNALFEKVWLNGVLVQHNVAVTGPTRAAAFTDEKPTGPLMIQGDHGPVALKNIEYKLYTGDIVSLKDITMSVIENKGVVLANIDSLKVLQKNAVDSISANMITDDLPLKILKFEGSLNIPKTGDYIFDLKLFEQGGIFLVNKDTIFNRNGVCHLDSLSIHKVMLKKGVLPFTFIYNKHRSWTNGFSLQVEGPEMQKHFISAPNSLDLSNHKPEESIMVTVGDVSVAQRSFLIHEGNKKTHCISVGNPQGVHYSYDLAVGSLLQVWDGAFFDASEMWFGRGEKQLGAAAGFIVSLHGDSEFAALANKNQDWPMELSDGVYKQLGYAFDANGFPVFNSKTLGSNVSSKLVPLANGRGLQRNIAISGSKELWFKVADGALIEKLADGSFLINDESYFIDFTGTDSLQPEVRKSGNKEELIVRIPAGEQQIGYSIIW